MPTVPGASARDAARAATGTAGAITEIGIGIEIGTATATVVAATTRRRSAVVNALVSGTAVSAPPSSAPVIATVELRKHLVRTQRAE
jgi:hypothetical protein